MLNKILENAKTVTTGAKITAKCATRAAIKDGYSGNARRLMRWFKAKLSA